jgi:hypothetical protein
MRNAIILKMQFIRKSKTVTQMQGYGVGVAHHQNRGGIAVIKK